MKTGIGKQFLICLLLVASGYLFVGLNTTVPFWPWVRTHDSLLLAYSLGFLSAALTLASWQNRPESTVVTPEEVNEPGTGILDFKPPPESLTVGVVVSLLSLTGLTGLTALPPAVWDGLFVMFLLGLLKVYTKHYYKIDLDGGELIRCRKRFNKVSEFHRSPLGDNQAVVLLARRRHDESGEGFQYSPAVWTNSPKLTEPLYWTHSYQEALTACRQIATAAKTPVYAGPPERETQVTFNRRGELQLSSYPARQRSPLFYIAIGAWVFTLICAGTV